MKKIAVFPGSFDPVTIGHVDIVDRALPLFDEIIVAIGHNADKKYMWSLEERKSFLEKTFGSYSQIKIDSYQGLTADFCKEKNADYIIRGVRNSSDYVYEKTIAQANKEVNGIDSIFIMCSPKYSHVSSTIIRDIARHRGDYSSLLPKEIR